MEYIESIRNRIAGPKNYNEPRTLQEFKIVDRKIFDKPFDYHTPLIINKDLPEYIIKKAMRSSILVFAINCDFSRLPQGVIEEFNGVNVYYKLNYENIQLKQRHLHEFRSLRPRTLGRVIKFIGNFGIPSDVARNIIKSYRLDKTIYEKLREVANVSIVGSNAVYFAKDLVELLDKSKINFKSIIDIGANTGELSVLISEQLKDKHKVICIDTRDNCETPCKCSEYIVYNGEHLPRKTLKKDNLFLMSMVLHHIDKNTRINLYRQIKNAGGYLLIREHDPGRFESIEQDKLFLSIQHGIYALIDKVPETPDFTDNFFEDFKPRSEWFEELKENGFELIQSKIIGHNFIALFK